jgi:hypothetical protein
VDLPVFEDVEEVSVNEDDFEVPDTITTDIVKGDLFSFRKN